MSRLVFNRTAGAADEYGHLLALARMMTGEVIQGLNVTAPGSVMAVTVNPGTAGIPTGTSPSDYRYWVAVDTVGGENVTISTAPAGNPRIDSIVAYVNKSATVNYPTTTVNQPGVLVLTAVAGTPNASPTAPNSSAIQSAIGAGNPYIVLANVTVGVGVTQITSGNIADVRNMYGTTPSANSVDVTKVNFGGAGAGIWWQEIGRTTLASSGDIITVTGFAVFKYLRVVTFNTATGGTTAALWRFNNDTGNNYAYRVSTNGGSETVGTSVNGIFIADDAADTFDKHAQLDVINIATNEKTVIGLVNANPVGAANSPGRREGVGKWANTTNAITRIDLVNSGTGHFAAGSEVVVLGHN